MSLLNDYGFGAPWIWGAEPEEAEEASTETTTTACVGHGWLPDPRWVVAADTVVALMLVSPHRHDRARWYDALRHMLTHNPRRQGERAGRASALYVRCAMGFVLTRGLAEHVTRRHVLAFTHSTAWLLERHRDMLPVHAVTELERATALLRAQCAAGMPDLPPISWLSWSADAASRTHVERAARAALPLLRAEYAQYIAR